MHPVLLTSNIVKNFTVFEVSSTMGVNLRFAPFLSAANRGRATAEYPLRYVLVRAARASAVPSPSRGEFSNPEPGDTLPRTSWRSLPPGAATSRGRCDRRPCTARPIESLPVAVSASRSGAAFGRDAAWPAGPAGPPFPTSPAIALPRIRKQRPFRPPRRVSHLPAAIFPPADAEFPTRLRFLSVSCTMVRMSTARCSLAMQGSIITTEALTPIVAQPR